MIRYSVCARDHVNVSELGRSFVVDTWTLRGLPGEIPPMILLRGERYGVGAYDHVCARDYVGARDHVNVIELGRSSCDHDGDHL